MTKGGALPKGFERPSDSDHKKNMKKQNHLPKQ